MRHHRAPVPPWRAGPRAAAAGAHALIDVSDGLVTDLGRVAAASGVRVDLDGAVLRERYAAGPLGLALGEAQALHQVLAGGEEHSLVGVFADEASLPGGADAGDGLDEPWRVVGMVLPETGEASGSPSTARSRTPAAGTTSPADRRAPSPSERAVWARRPVGM